MKYVQYDFLVRLIPPKYTEKSTFRSLILSGAIKSQLYLFGHLT